MPLSFHRRLLNSLNDQYLVFFFNENGCFRAWWERVSNTLLFCCVPRHRMCKHIIMKWNLNEPLFTALPYTFSCSFLSLFNHRVLINLTSISIHLCINKNHELCCGYRVQFLHELLPVSFIHISVQYKSNSSLQLFSWAFMLQLNVCCEMLLKFIKIHWSWAMIIYCVKVFAACKVRKYSEKIFFQKNLLKMPYRRRTARTQIDQSCMKLQN